MISLFLALLSVPAFAGDKAGNGGNVVLCRSSNGKVSSVKLLDHYEAQTIWGFKLDLGAPSLDPRAKVKLALERARRFHPLTADALEARAAGFFDDALLVSNVELTPVDDSGEYFLPVGCQLKQIAVQRAKEFPQDKTFLINKDVWDQLDNDGKAGLILHEIAYEKLLHTKPPFGPTPVEPESRMARYFNALVSSAGFDQLNFAQYLPQLADLWFLTDLAYDGALLTQVTASERNGVRGQLPKDSATELDFNGQRAQLVPGTWVSWRGDRLVEATPVMEQFFTLKGEKFESRAGRDVQLYPSGEPQGFFLSGFSPLTWKGRELLVEGQLQVYQDGTPNFVHLANDTHWPAYIPADYVITGKKGSASFNPDGSLRSLGCLKRDNEMMLEDTQGRIITCHAGEPKCTYSSDLGPIDRPQSITLDSVGRVQSLLSYDPKNDFCNQ